MLDPLFAATTDERTATLEATHATYQQYADDWRVLLDAFEGAGGFNDGGYLWQYGAEIGPDYQKRRQQARYHNFVAALVELYLRYVLSRGVVRQTTNAALEAWWRDVDAAGTSIDTFVRQALGLSLAVSHAGALVDRTPDEPKGPAVADERSRVIATLYPPTAILDWRFTRGAVTGLKLREQVPPTSIAVTAPTGDEAEQYLLWDTEEWARFTSAGEPLPEGRQEHGLGLVPFASLRTQPLLRDAMAGRSLCGHAGIVRALFNRMSEEDETLRGQAFALLAAQMPSDASPDDVASTQTSIAQNYGVNRVIVTKADITRVNADMTGPQQLQSNIDFLIRELFRAAHVPFEDSSKQTQTAEAITAEHRELNEMLHGVAAAAQAFELALARFWCAWQAQTPAAGEALYQAADVQIIYPREFFTEKLADDLAAWATALSSVSSETWRKHVEKRIVRRVDPDLQMQEPALLAQIEQEIDASPPAPAPGAAGMDLRARAEQRLSTFMVAPEEPEPAGVTG